MIKLCTSADWDWGTRSVNLLPATAAGVDPGWLQKFAHEGDHREWLRKIASVKDHELVHVIAVADTEYWGYNRNGDGFSGQDNCRTHDGFVKRAHVFRNHKHDISKHPTFGRPVASFYHPAMHRIELVNAVSTKTAADIIDDVARGRDVAWSMGSDVPFDVCTVCGNKARSPKEYCIHAKRPNLGRLLKTGQICALDNPNADWFDISHVGRPAERIAYTMRMVKAAMDLGTISIADGEEVCGGAERAKIAGITLPDFMQQPKSSLSKWAALQALASMEKHVPAQLFRGITPDELDEKAEEAIHRKAAADGSLNQVMEDLHSRGIYLRPAQLFKIAFGKDAFVEVIEPLMDEVRSCLPSSFSQALESGAKDLIDEGRFDGCGELKAKAMPREYEESTHGCEEKASIDDAHVESRTLRKAVFGPPGDRITIITKTASEHPAAKGLADLYTAYGLAFVTHPHNGKSTLAKRAVVMTNQEESTHDG